MKEKVYENSYNTADQDRWLQFFTEIAQADVIFSGIRKSLENRNIELARRSGKLWYEFSAFMPYFLTKAASQLDTNEQRAYITQVAYEELGYGDPEKMHYLDFEKALMAAGIDKSEAGEVSVAVLLDGLKECLLHKTDDAGVLGMCLGLEIIANENIDSLFESLAYNEEARKSLSQSIFFKIHRVNEDDHIALNVANFIRFCDTEEKRNSFIYGFKESTAFWQKYWSKVSE
jgi:hypothetical protein